VEENAVQLCEIFGYHSHVANFNVFLRYAMSAGKWLADVST
jgi:hypothetical protein